MVHVAPFVGLHMIKSVKKKRSNVDGLAIGLNIFSTSLKVMLKSVAVVVGGGGGGHGSVSMDLFEAVTASDSHCETCFSVDHKVPI